MFCFSFLNWLGGFWLFAGLQLVRIWFVTFYHARTGKVVFFHGDKGDSYAGVLQEMRRMPLFSYERVFGVFALRRPSRMQWELQSLRVRLHKPPVCYVLLRVARRN
jgi:hypothetical protein